MRFVILYRPKSEHAGVVEDYLREFNRRHPRAAVETINIDSQTGAGIARLYGVVRYPALMAIADNGSLLELWQDQPLPLANEVDFYVQSA